MCGQMSTSSKRAPWLSRICIISSCGPVKSALGKLFVPSPSWFETMTSFQPASRRRFRAGRTPSTNLIFSKQST